MVIHRKSSTSKFSFFRSAYLLFDAIPQTATERSPRATSPHARNPQKYFQKVAFFQPRKTTIQPTTQNHALTTNSPQKTITQTAQNLRNPS
jgi:hypothetical protein